MSSGPRNSHAAEIDVLWCGWDQDRRGVELLARRVEPGAPTNSSVEIGDVGARRSGARRFASDSPCACELDSLERCLVRDPRSPSAPGVTRGRRRAHVGTERDRSQASAPDAIAWRRLDGHLGGCRWARRSGGGVEPEETAFVERFLTPGMVVDVGAHGGFYSVLARNKVGPSGTVIAFEPSPRERRRLALNLRLNRFRDVRVVPSAVGETSGETDFYVVHGVETGFGGRRQPDAAPHTSHSRARTSCTSHRRECANVLARCQAAPEPAVGAVPHVGRVATGRPGPERQLTFAPAFAPHMRISVIGLGKLGCPLAVVLATRTMSSSVSTWTSRRLRALQPGSPRSRSRGCRNCSQPRTRQIDLCDV